MAISVMNSSKTDQCDNKIASGWAGESDEQAMYPCRCCFILAAHAKQYLDKHTCFGISARMPTSGSQDFLHSIGVFNTTLSK
jgi:hypothetical protein